MEHELQNHCKRFGHLPENGVCKRCSLDLEVELKRLLGDTLEDMIKINSALSDLHP